MSRVSDTGDGRGQPARSRRTGPWAEGPANHDERFKALVESSADLIVVLDARMHLLYSNPAASRILGIDPEKVGRLDVASLIHPDDVRGVVHRFLSHTVNMEGTGEPLELRLRTSDGRWRTVEAIGTNLLGDPAVRGVVVNVRDVTTERDAVHRFQEELAAREAWSRAILTNAFDLMVAVSAQGRVIFATPATQHLLGVDDSTPVDEDIFSYVHPDEVKMIRRAIARAVNGTDLHEVLQCRVRHRDGTYRWLEVIGTNMLDDPAVGAIVIHGHDVTERRLAQERSAYQASHDALTDLPNRHLLHDRIVQALARARRAGTTVATIFMDLDNFKFVNDSAGHNAGDSVLREVADRLKGASRLADTVARFGGDEFVVVIEDVRDEQQVRETAERTLQVLFGTPFAAAGTTVYLSASVGIALDGGITSPDRLLADADAAMYTAKHGNGHSRIAVFVPSMRAAMTTYLKNEEALRRALENEEITAFFQPIVALDDERIVGAEALARWRHPVQGVIPAVEFVPVAEATGLIGHVSSLVFEKTCRELARIQTRWPELPFSMSLNLSLSQMSTDTPPPLLDIARAVRVDPRRLVVEITETSLLEEDAELLEWAHTLHVAGIRVAADDFGTGYSSLSHLKRLPIDILKIDRSFVDGVGRDPYDTAIVDAIMAMAATLKLEVVAEGVETEEQRVALVQRGCHLAQGFLFGPPLTASQLEAEIALRLAHSETGSPAEALGGVDGAP